LPGRGSVPSKLCDFLFSGEIPLGSRVSFCLIGRALDEKIVRHCRADFFRRNFSGPLLLRKRSRRGKCGRSIKSSPARQPAAWTLRGIRDRHQRHLCEIRRVGAYGRLRAVNRQTGEAVADGNVRIEEGDQIWVGEHIRYNFKTHQMQSEQFSHGANRRCFAARRAIAG